MQRKVIIASVKIKRLVFLAVLMMGIFLLLACDRDNQSLFMQIKDPRSGTVFYEVEVEPGAVFTLSYRHSVSGSAVKGTFMLTTEGKIKPLTTVYSSFGPGLPLDYKNYSIENGLITVCHDEGPRENIRLWVSPQTEELVIVDDHSYPLSTLADSHLLLDISFVKNRSGSLP